MLRLTNTATSDVSLDLKSDLRFVDHQSPLLQLRLVLLVIAFVQLL